MCLITESKRCGVAGKPIPCYKVVWKKSYEPHRFTSEFFDFPYEIGVEYKAGNGFVTVNRDHALTVSEGFHSYARLKDAVEECPGCDEKSMMTFGIRDYWSLVILKCEIPEGARYWIGNKSPDDKNYMEYCSDRIRVLAWRAGDDTKWRSGTKKEEETCA